jgi:hypothetical protein
METTMTPLKDGKKKRHFQRDPHNGNRNNCNGVVIVENRMGSTLNAPWANRNFYEGGGW